MDNNRKKTIEGLKNKLLPCIENVFWKGQKEHPEKTELLGFITSAIQDLELLDKVESGGVEKKKENTELLKTCGFVELVKIRAYNEAIDLCNAHWAGKMEGIAQVIKNQCGWKYTYNKIEYEKIDKLSQAIVNYLTEKTN